MRYRTSRQAFRRNLAPSRWLMKMLAGLMICGGVFSLSVSDVLARSVATPWTDQMGVQNLALGSSSTADVVRIMGAPPDDILRLEQMFPTIENFYYYDADKSGAATVFVFENSFLVGMQMRTAGGQFVDMTYMLPNNGDRRLMGPMLGGFMPYFPLFPIPSW